MEFAIFSSAHHEMDNHGWRFIGSPDMGSGDEAEALSLSECSMQASRANLCLYNAHSRCTAHGLFVVPLLLP